MAWGGKRSGAAGLAAAVAQDKRRAARAKANAAPVVRNRTGSGTVAAGRGSVSEKLDGIAMAVAGTAGATG